MTDSPYIESINDYTSILEKALIIAKDPFKAPELVVETADAVIGAAYNMKMEYIIMRRGYIKP